jgi:hypothetical protein
MNNFRKSLVAFFVLEMLAGCSSREEKLRAIAEVEKHCGLPPNSLNRNFVDDRFDVSKEMNASQSSKIAKTISLGDTIMDRRILDKRECIINYKSTGGFFFMFHASGAVLGAKR